MLAFFKWIDLHTPRELDVHIVLDNLSAHKSEPVRTWLAHPRRERWHLHFTPTSASELPPFFWRVGLCRVGVFVLYRREHVGAGVAALAVVPLVDPGGDVSAGLKAGGVAAP